MKRKDLDERVKELLKGAVIGDLVGKYDYGSAYVPWDRVQKIGMFFI